MYSSIASASMWPRLRSTMSFCFAKKSRCSIPGISFSVRGSLSSGEVGCCSEAKKPFSVSVKCSSESTWKTFPPGRNMIEGPW